MSEDEGVDNEDVSPIDRLVALYYRVPTDDESLHVRNEDDED